MHSAVCDECGRKCEVPFRPTGDKLVYCDNCFDKNKTSRTGDSRGTGRGSDDVKKQLDILNIKLDKVLEILSVSGIVDIDDEIEPKIDWDIIEDETIADEIKEEMIKTKPVSEKKSKEEKKKEPTKKDKVENKKEKKKPADKKAPVKKK